MIWSAVLILSLSAAPPLEVRPGLEPATAIAEEARAGWERLETLFQHATDRAPTATTAPLRIQRAEGLPTTQAGQSRPGVILLRQNTPFTFDARNASALRHELAHQFLFVACPAARDDALFHEAFALATSGELEAWLQGPYLSLTNAALQLRSARNLDAPDARRALARLLSEHPRAKAGLPEAIVRRLRICADDARWGEPLSIAELSAHAGWSEGDPGALVILSRHSGEVLVSEGEPSRPRPFGSALKPFVVAGARHLPLLAPDPSRVEWACGKGLPKKVDARLALLRSCNGYFLDWERPRAPFVPPASGWWRSAIRRPFTRLSPGSFGSWGPALTALGLSRPSTRVAEAIGLDASLQLSPIGLAHAYRLLAESRPELIAWLSANAAEGTLSELPSSPALRGVALKTGTVRDAESRPRYGWIAAVEEDVVIVLVRASTMPRLFAAELVATLTRARALPGVQAAKVQTFGLLPSREVQVRCTGKGFVAKAEGPRLLGEGFTPLAPLTKEGSVLCFGAPLRVRFAAANMPPDGREYAGSFTHMPLPSALEPGARKPEKTPRPRTSLTLPTLKEQRARRGSEFIFRTTRARYVTGVLASEDAAIRGEARVALARVIDHNQRHGHLRHPGRPICDTTHCQVFQGTQRRKPEDEATLALGPLPFPGWLPFSRGGLEPWEHRRPVHDVELLFGYGAAGTLRFDKGQVRYVIIRQDRDTPFEEQVTLPCERLRSALRLPSCPIEATVAGSEVVFRGRGEGHGEGLDVEWARASGLSAEAILERAYGPKR